MTVADSDFLRAAQGLPVSRTPIWLMRQAGRFLPEYRALRTEKTFMQLVQDPELAARVTIMPARLGVDALVLFADILLPLTGMGIGFSFSAGDGPVIESPVRLASDVERLHECEPREHLAYVADTIGVVLREAPHLPLLGFAGAPFTLASYIIEGGHSANFALTKQFMYEHESAFASMMSKIAVVTRRYLQMQVDAGVHAIQLFDSWVGCLSPRDYERYVLPHSQSILQAFESQVPTIHFATGTAGLLELQAQAGGMVLGVDHRVDIGDAHARTGMPIQGNLDPLVLLAPTEVIEREAKAILARAKGFGHIFNLGHGVLPETPVESVQALIECVHRGA
jgi:uroporphyrinogen decarboxylase